MSDCLALALALVSVALYLPQGLHFFFQNDDWVYIGHFGRWPVRDFWRIFLPWESIWMYRPLQVLLYAGLYKAVGLNPLLYNIVLLGMHAVAAWLTYVLIRTIANTQAALIALSVFALTWVHGEALLWKGNFNTLLHAVMALAACICFVRACGGGKRGWHVAANAFVLLDLLAKESAVFTPGLMLLSVWCAVDVRVGDWRRWVRLIAPAGILCAIYVVIRMVAFRHVLEDEPTYYGFVGVRRAIFQFLYVYKYALLSFYEDPWLAPHIPGARAALAAMWGPLLVMPALLVWLGVHLRDRTLLFGLAWLPVAFGPSLALEEFNVGRYYYLADIGAAVIWARLIQLAIARIAKMSSGVARYGAMAVGSLLLGYMALANFATIRKQVREQQDDSVAVQRLFGFIAENRAEIPAGSLVWIYPPAHRQTGVEWGAREMVQFATGEPSLEGQVDKEPISMARRAKLDGFKRLELDMRQEPWHLSKGR